VAELHMKVASLSILATLLAFPVKLLAYCDGGYPNVAVSEEVKEAAFIVVGTVTKRKIVLDPEGDPDGYEAELFSVTVEAVLYGTVPDFVLRDHLAIYNFNASSRYPMNVGDKQVLFVSLGADGNWVNSCGNSSLYSDATRTIKEIEHLKTKRK
jgi:hypothetical protein